MVKKYLFFIILCLFSLSVFGQVGIPTPDPRGILDLNKKTGTSDYGLVLPTTSDPANITNPQGDAVVKGTMIYDSTEDCVKVNLGGLWSECLGTGTVVPPKPGQSKTPLRWTMTTEAGSIGFGFGLAESNKPFILRELQNKNQFGQNAGSIYKRYPYISWNKQPHASVCYTYTDVLKYDTDILSHNPGNLGISAESSSVMKFVTDGGVAVLPLPATPNPQIHYFLIDFKLPYDGYASTQTEINSSVMLQTTNHADNNGPFGDVRNKSVSAKITGYTYYAKIPVSRLPAGTILYATRDGGKYAALFATGPGNRILFYDSAGLIAPSTYDARNPEFVILFKNALAALMDRVNK